MSVELTAQTFNNLIPLKFKIGTTKKVCLEIVLNSRQSKQFSINMSQWGHIEDQIRQLEENPEEFKKEIIRSYFDSKGGIDVFRTRDLKTNNIMKSLGLWQIDECNRIRENNLHSASSCRQMVAALTKKVRK